MSSEGFPFPANDNAPEVDQVQLDKDLEELRNVIDKGEKHVEAQGKLATLITEIEEYLKRADANEVRVLRLSYLLNEAMADVAASSEFIQPASVEKVEHTHALLRAFLDSHNEKGAD